MQNFINPYTIPINNSYQPKSLDDIRTEVAAINGYTPMQTPLNSAQGTSQPEPSQDTQLQDALQAARQAVTVARPLRGTYTPTLNPIHNVAGDAGDVATGLLTLFTSPIQTAKTVGKRIGDYYTDMAYSEMPAWERGLKGFIDLPNTLILPGEVGYDDLKNVVTGKVALKDVIAREALNAYAHPVTTVLDVGLLKSFGKAKNVAKAATTGDVVEDAIVVTRKPIAQEGYKIKDTASKFSKRSNEVKESALEAAETGMKVSSKETKEGIKDLREIYETYDNLVKEQSPNTWVPGNVLSTNQKLLREGLASSYAEAEKMTARLFNDERIFKFSKGGDYGEVGLKQGLDMIEGKAPLRPNVNLASKERILTKEGEEILEQMAKDGDVIAEKVLESDKLFKKGWLFPVTHGLAEVTKSELDDIAVASAKAARTGEAGRFTERVYGNASYKDIAKELDNPSPWLDSQMKRMTEEAMANELSLNGTLGGVNALAQVGEKGTMYLNKKLLDEGKLAAAVEGASRELKLADDIPVSKEMVKTLKQQLTQTAGANPFGRNALGTAYDIQKGTFLGSLGYLVGNFNTAAANALFNSNIHLVNDFAAALTTKGKLLKEMGIYRDLRKPNLYKGETAVPKFIHWANAPFGQVANYLDTKIQNLFGEMAAHARLRESGIASGARLEHAANMTAQELGEAVRDARRIANMFGTKTITPPWMLKSLGLVNPFPAWMDTAAQSGAYVFKKHPLLAYYVTTRNLADVALDVEMQNRFNLGVESDKPFVRYRMNPRTGKLQEYSAEMLPQMNTLRVFGTLARAIEGKENPLEAIGRTSPMFSPILYSFAGKNTYGKPITRPEMSSTDLQNMMSIQGDRRYKWDENSYSFKEVGWMPSETLGTAINSLFVLPNLYNKTIAPMISGITGDTYYKPYQGQVLGTFNKPGYGQLPLQAGNPRAGANSQEALDFLRGIYAQEYYPERDLTEGQMRRMFRGNIRRNFNNMEYIR